MDNSEEGIVRRGHTMRQKLEIMFKKHFFPLLYYSFYLSKIYLVGISMKIYDFDNCAGDALIDSLELSAAFEIKDFFR